MNGIVLTALLADGAMGLLAAIPETMIGVDLTSGAFLPPLYQQLDQLLRQRGVLLATNRVQR